MMPTGLFSQVALILLSLGIVFTYIKPTLSEITKTQDTIVTYQVEQTKVSEVNVKLQRVMSAVNQVSSEDQQRLLTYMPDMVDTIAVPRDLNAIASATGVILSQIKYEGPRESNQTAQFSDPSLQLTPTVTGFEPEAHVFSYVFDASYEQIKAVLAALEKNAYPLEVHDMNIEKTEGGFLKVTMKLVTYDRMPPEEVAIDQVSTINPI
jgi:hypothetical protein